jgi:ribonuclease-3
MNDAMAMRAAMVAEIAEYFAIPLPDDLLNLALTHRSYAFENGGLPTNERLEFLGDSVLGLVITDELYRRHPDRPEGDLARMRASVVNARSLAEVASALGLGECVLLGKGEESTGGRDKPSILADTMEALLGAMFLTVGFEESRVRILALFSPLITRAGHLGAGLDWKTSLQELASKKGMGVPRYRVESTGPDHARSFNAEVELDGTVWGRGDGSAKKHAEQEAAEEAWRAIGGQLDPAWDSKSVDGER